MHFLSIHWNPSEGIDLGFFMLRYYSLMFVVAFVLGWFIMKKIYEREGLTVNELDSLFIYTVLATLIGARLGHFLFYEPEMFIKDPLHIFLPVEFSPKFRIVGFRGLASHGAAIGIIIAMFYYSKKIIHKPILWILDRIVIPVSLGGIFVRIGNFMNSEIIGKPTNGDYGVIFEKLREDFPRHPTQLYEASGYLLVFLILWYIYWKTEKRNKLGYIFGVFLILLWAVRFIVEFFKENQVPFEDQLSLNMGQWLSIPFILFGIYLVLRNRKDEQSNNA
ncbi:prolipoprotein diacylglyceryl transferase [Sinomicrobium sp.]